MPGFKLVTVFDAQSGTKLAYLAAYNLSIYLKSHIKELAKARISTLRHKLINLPAAIKRAAGLVYVDAVFKEHLPRGRIKFDNH